MTDLQSSIKIPSKNKASGILKVIGVGSGSFVGSLTSRIRCTSSLSSSLKLPTVNKMSVLVDVSEKPRNKILLTPTRDSFVREKSPRLNYGERGDLFVGRSSFLNEKYRSFLSFDVSSIPNNVEIVRAEIKLFHDQYSSPIQTIEAYQVDREWTEGGLTWANQPTSSIKIAESIIEQSVGYSIFNITQTVIDWRQNGLYNGGLYLKAKDETLDSYVLFYSKESQRPPILEIEYINTNVYSAGRNQFSSSIMVNILGEQQFSGNLYIQSLSRYEEFPANIKLSNMLESSIEIVRTMLLSSIKVRNKRSDNLSSSLAVRMLSKEDFDSWLAVSKPTLAASILSRIRSNENMLSSISVRAFGEQDLIAQLATSRPYAVGSIDVQPVSKLDSTIWITPSRKGSICVQHHDRLISSISVAPSIKSHLVVRHSSKFASSILISPALKGNIDVKHISQFESSVIVSPALKGSVGISHWKILPSSIQIINYGDKKLDSNIVIRHNKEIDIHSSLFVEHYREFDSSIFVPLGHLRSNLLIPYYAKHDFRSGITVRIRTAEDLWATIEILSNEGYVYLM